MEKMTRAQQTKTKIFETALRLFQEDSYENVTIKRICKEADVSVGNFYHYFESKEAVLMAKYVEFDSWLDDLDLSQDVEKIIMDIIDLQTEGAKKIGRKVFVKVMQTHLTTNGKYVSANRKFNKYLSDLAARGIREGLFDPAYEPETIADVILRTSRGVLFDWASREAPYDVQTIARHDIAIVLRGLATYK